MELGLLQPEPECLLINGRSQVEPRPGPPSPRYLYFVWRKDRLAICCAKTAQVHRGCLPVVSMFYTDGTSLMISPGGLVLASFR